MSAWVNCSAMSACTISRLAAMHSWPALYSAAATTSSAVLAMLVSSNTITGALPPSSRMVRCGPPAAARAIARPVAVEPVNETRSTPGWPARYSPTVAPRPWTMFSTPAGSQSGECRDAQGCVVGGLDDDGIPSGHSRNDLPHRLPQRVVPRCDAGDHTDGLATHE